MFSEHVMHLLLYIFRNANLSVEVTCYSIVQYDLVFLGLSCVIVQDITLFVYYLCIETNILNCSPTFRSLRCFELSLIIIIIIYIVRILHHH